MGTEGDFSTFGCGIRLTIAIYAGPGPEHPGIYVSLHCFTVNLDEYLIIPTLPDQTTGSLRTAREEICTEEGEWRQLVRDEEMMAAAK